VIVPKHRQTVVRRNRLKRQLREVLRLELLPRLEQAEPAQSVLIRARREAYGAEYAELADEIMRWADSRWRVSS
jgi:ribonuclease P protein component